MTMIPLTANTRYLIPVIGRMEMEIMDVDLDEEWSVFHLLNEPACISAFLSFPISRDFVTKYSLVSVRRMITGILVWKITIRNEI